MRYVQVVKEEVATDQRSIDLVEGYGFGGIKRELVGKNWESMFLEA